VCEIVKALEHEASTSSSTSDWAKSTLEALHQRSPISLHVSLAAMRATLDKTRYEAFQREYELASHFMRESDFVEGVTARLIKRTEPAWSLPQETLYRPSQWVKENIVEKGKFNDKLNESFFMLEKGEHVSDEGSGLFKYSLPMEMDVAAALNKGSAGVDAQKIRYLGKNLVGAALERPGASEKLDFIVDRKTKQSRDGERVWISDKHS
jgi:Enoyl-CoA hydratase/isomerase